MKMGHAPGCVSVMFWDDVGDVGLLICMIQCVFHDAGPKCIFIKQAKMEVRGG